jgi:hypothetical protein
VIEMWEHFPSFIEAEVAYRRERLMADYRRANPRGSDQRAGAVIQGRRWGWFRAHGAGSTHVAVCT